MVGLKQEKESELVELHRFAFLAPEPHHLSSRSRIWSIKMMRL
jgi:hypothetical protein